MLLTRARSPPGWTSTSASARSLPEVSVPVTTVPNPFMENTRSIGRRAKPPALLGSTARPASSSIARSSCKPAPVCALTATVGADSRNDPATDSSTSSLTNSTMSSSARSALVSTTMPRRIPNRRQMSKCSRVCGISDSSAATASSSRSMPPAPANMFFTKRSWPGTSTKPSRKSSLRSKWAKPRSMVMPRRFSSSQRSVSMPVSARTSDVLPWSI